MTLKTLEEALAEIRKLSGKYTYSEAVEIEEASSQYCPQWDNIVGTEVQQGQLIAKDGVKYWVKQTHTTSSVYPPDGDGVLALYQAYQGSGLAKWIAGEYCEIGYQRAVGDVVYTAIQDPGANIYSPELVPAVWEVDD